jgi:hypothetical protein
MITVLCSTEHGGCGTEHVLRLDNLIEGRSRGCYLCRDRRLRLAQEDKQQ